MDAFDIAITGIFAIVLLYGAFGLLIIETCRAYRDIRISKAIRNAAAHQITTRHQRAAAMALLARLAARSARPGNASAAAPTNPTVLLAPRERHPWEFGDITTQRVTRDARTPEDKLIRAGANPLAYLQMVGRASRSRQPVDLMKGFKL